ncbi:TetR/AcrR family transcriptional regulator [Halonatronum saccharophilum]|uniref:TetR/AcrR family transcriptional regulator n=1 Tax=Halonatronum saccharophilum TaxID=150060 RepID=UPI0004811E2E|nr:TetR/AcrR family transcriptional regulator [Halonatronum saccharophilum]
MNNRSKILEVALDLFAMRGYDGVGVQEIVEGAGITKPTLYHYFGSKRGLLDSLLQEKFGLFNKIIKKSALYNHDLPLTINNLVESYFQFAKENSRFYRMKLSLFFAPPMSEASKAVDGFIKEQYKIIESLFIKASKDYGNMKGRHRSYAATLLGTINTYIRLSLEGEVDLNQELVRRVAHQFMHGIYS